MERRREEEGVMELRAEPGESSSELDSLGDSSKHVTNDPPSGSCFELEAGASVFYDAINAALLLFPFHLNM